MCIVNQVRKIAPIWYDSGIKQGTVSCSAIDKIIRPNREVNHDRKIL